MMQQLKKTLVLSIGGGKGGVGKSMVCSNLAVQYAQVGLKTVLIDLDVGAANLHTIFGIRQPSHNLGEFFVQTDSSLSDFLIDTSVKNLYLIPGSGFVPELANLTHVQKQKIIRQFSTLEADVILLDLGAGSSNNVIDFFSMTNQGVIVTTPEPTAIVNTYEFLKNVIYRILFRMFRNQECILQMVKESVIPKDQKTMTIAQLIDKIKTVSPWSAENIQEVCNDLTLYVLFNQARKPDDIELIKKLHDICLHYLNISLNVSGLIFHTEEIRSSVVQMSPVSLSNPKSIATKCLHRHALTILNHIIHSHPEEDFTYQFERASYWSQSDFIENHLIQKKIQQDREIRMGADFDQMSVYC